jgi:hypothetical protein
MNQIFVVGCSRSGTTVVQKSLVQQFNLTTLPETAFFLGRLRTGHTRAKRLRKLNQFWLGMHEPADEERLTVKLGGLVWFWGRRAEARLLLPALASPGGCARFFASAMDRRARMLGAEGWLEKTPRHFYEIDFIHRHLPGAKFIYVVRNGPDTVASIVDRAISYPALFPEQKDWRCGVSLWNDSVRLAHTFKDHANVLPVSFETFTRDPDGETQRIGGWLALAANGPAAVRPGATEDFITQAEGWKQGVRKPVTPPPSKWREVFSATEQQEIMQGLDLGTYGRIFPEP